MHEALDADDIPSSSAFLPQACGIGVGLQLLQTSAPKQRPALAEAAGLQDVQPRGLETSTSNLSLLTVSGCSVCWGLAAIRRRQQLSNCMFGAAACPVSMFAAC